MLRRTLLALLGGACVGEPDMGRLHILAEPELLHNAPIITNAMVASAGFAQSSNTNFPQMFEAPEWATGLAGLGPALLIFSDHNNKEGPRVAHAPSFETPPGDWTILPPDDVMCTSLGLQALRDVTGRDAETYSEGDNHVGSYHLSFMDFGGDERVVYAHAHAEIVTPGAPPEGNQGFRHGHCTGVSGDNLQFYRDEMIDLGFDSGLVNDLISDVPSNMIGREYRWLPYEGGSGQGGSPHYLRPWWVMIDGVRNWFAVGNGGDIRRCVYDGTDTPDPRGIHKWRRQSSPSVWTNPLQTGGLTNTRHTFMLLDNAEALGGYCMFTSPDETGADPTKSEHIRIVRAKLTGSWHSFAPVGSHWSFRTPSTNAEGIDIAPGSAPGAINGRKRATIDMSAYRASNGSLYIPATSAGEQGIVVFKGNLIR